MERGAERGAGDRHQQDQPRALHGNGGRGGARRPRQTHLRLPPEAAGQTAESRNGEDETFTLY